MPAIHLWRYKDNRRNYPGYHLTANAAGCDQFAIALQTAIQNNRESTIRLHLHPVTNAILDVPNNTNAQHVALSTLEIIVDQQSVLPIFNFTESHPTVRLRMNRGQAECILKGLDDIKHDKGDYCIGADGDNVIWFWWYPKA